MRRTDSDTVPRVEREEAKVSQTKAEMAIEAARSKLASVELESRAETQLLQLEVEENEREVVELEEQLDKTVLRAPTDGVVLLEEKWDGYWTVGSRPWGSAELMSLPDLSAMEVAAKVHEVDAPKVRKGQRARIELDAYPGRVLTGEVSQVADLAVAQGDDEIKYLDIEVSLQGEQAQLLPGMSSRVELVLEEVDDAVWVPREAVFRDGDEAWVFSEGLTGWSRTEVQLGLANDTHVVVSEGLSAGAVVSLVDPTRDDDERPAAVLDDEGAGEATTP
jgi:RND family efflux transporter MFP subunit